MHKKTYMFVDFNKNYHTAACESTSSLTTNTTSSNISLAVTTVASTVSAAINTTDSAHSDHSGYVEECLRENSILFLLLMLGTVWVGITLFNFTKT